MVVASTGAPVEVMSVDGTGDVSVADSIEDDGGELVNSPERKLVKLEQSPI